MLTTLQYSVSQVRLLGCGEDSKQLAPPHLLAWDADLVITTFERLSLEWAARKRRLSTLLSIHWKRVILDEAGFVPSSPYLWSWAVLSVVSSREVYH